MTGTTIRVEPAQDADLSFIVRLEHDEQASRFITPATLEEHRAQLALAENVYLRVLDQGTPAGFFILVLEPGGRSVEFRRIVIGRRERGTGQRAIEAMEQYCSRHLRRQRIWLDVFEDNERARHVYEKLGYRQFRQGELRGRTLLFYEKLIE